MRFEEYDEVKEKATSFWEHHKLGKLVDEEEFVKGAMLFKDLKGARLFEYQNRSRVFTDEEKAGFSLREEFFAGLTPRQNTALRWYARSTVYRKEHKGDSLAKKVLFGVGDALVDAICDRPKGVKDKSLWDHVKSFSSAQWQIFATCCLAAMTQYVLRCPRYVAMKVLIKEEVGTSRQ